MRLGVIGAGRWGKRYIETIARVDGVDLAHLGSTNPQSVALIPKACRLSSDWRAVTTDRGLDGIIVATPPATHLEIALAAIHSGIPVLVEKPMTLSLDDAATLARVASAQRVLVMVDHTHLFSPAFRALRERAAGLGPVLGVRSAGANHGPVRPDTPVLWDWGPHDISMSVALFGELPHTVEARRSGTHAMDGGIGEAIEIMLEFTNGRRSEIRVSNIESRKRRWLEARYAEATLVYDDLASDKLTLRRKRSGDAQAIPIDGATSLTTVVREFCQGINAGNRSDPSLPLGYQVVEILAHCQARLDDPRMPTVACH